MHKVLLLALGLAATPASASNFLTNAGFETGNLSPWTTSAGSATISNAQAHTGQFSVAAFGGDAIKQTFGAVETSAISEVSFWVKRAGGPFNAYSFFYNDSTNMQFIAFGGSSDWQSFNVTSNLAAGKSLIGFEIYGTSSGPAYLDDFVINASTSGVPEPSTWAMLLTGFGAVGYAMRRCARARTTVTFA